VLDVLVLPHVLVLSDVLHYSDDTIVVLTSILSSPRNEKSEDTVNATMPSAGCVSVSQASHESPHDPKHVARSRAEICRWEVLRRIRGGMIPLGFSSMR
jgi:hypothetical protein